MTSKFSLLAGTMAAALAAATCAYAEDAPGTLPGARAYSPYPAETFPNRVFFGDTHLHTAYSADAGMIGNTLGPEEAYRYARGETVVSSTGVPARLERPLDFMVVADHAENLGLAPLLAARDPGLIATPFGQALIARIDAADPAGAFETWSKAKAGGKDPLAGSRQLYADVWQKLTAAAEAYNEPGRFTSSSAAASLAPIRSFRFPASTRSIPRTSGRGWRRPRRPPAGCSLSPTTVTCRTG
jgi:Protein of unknown function (DUF3604)